MQPFLSRFFLGTLLNQVFKSQPTDRSPMKSSAWKPPFSLFVEKRSFANKTQLRADSRVALLPLIRGIVSRKPLSNAQMSARYKLNPRIKQSMIGSVVHQWLKRNPHFRAICVELKMNLKSKRHSTNSFPAVQNSSGHLTTW